MFVCFADILVNGAAALAVGLVVYLGLLSFREKRKQRKEQKQREGLRREHWGYE
jgi:hypothetical protein